MSARTFRRGFALIAALALGACTTIPTGPSVMVLPGDGKNFDQFRFDDADCRRFAQTQSGTTADDASTDSGIKSAAIGAGVGAIAGAVIGGRKGAGVGAGTGIAIGSVAG
ncbi:MAG: glycine zipper family protein, partial [Proteobacteria bacterium]|nr:glycine zipper family protein [Pseudomonadota bacterium]